MKRIIHSLIFILSALSPLQLFAVTDKEMEEARTIATKTYLRYANNGSGYLDDLNPKTMAELEKSLKEKEKANIKAFKAITVPSGWQSWNKQQLVDFWGGTAFNSKGLTDKGREGKSRARKLIGNMAVGNPSAAPTAPAPEKTAPVAEQPVEVKPSATATAEASVAETEAKKNAEAEAMAELAGKMADAFPEEEEITVAKADSYTWIYVVVLILLVGVVVALVVFASNVIKRNGFRTQQFPGAAGTAEDTAAAEKIAELTRRLEEAQRKIEQLQKAASHENQTYAPAEAKPTVIPAAKPAIPSAPKAEPARSGRSIYLGRANAKGLFVRADRNVNPGNTFFLLDTTDGFVGSFRIIDNPEVLAAALANPTENLSGACTGVNPAEADVAETIVTDSAGTAVFEGGCWKVIRKAKIHFE